MIIEMIKLVVQDCIRLTVLVIEYFPTPSCVLLVKPELLMT